MGNTVEYVANFSKESLVVKIEYRKKDRNSKSFTTELLEVIGD